ncbi:MAG: ATP phosphoribosyltransferase [Mariprofundaceae bacterium]|nr:ATP phosphoribosyltransferase [Mariprofundaceae bacterium]
MSQPLVIALAKGRILEDILPLLKKVNLIPEDDLLKTRKLMIKSTDGRVNFLLIRNSDVCTYVERGAADMGIVGRDLLLEFRPRVFEQLDLKIGKCRLCTAYPKGKSINKQQGAHIRVATKYDYLAQQYYRRHGMQAEIIHLYGSMELAPLIGMADYILDVVSTGATLKANELVEEDSLFNISSRLIINPASFALRRKEIQPLVEFFREAVGEA